VGCCLSPKTCWTILCERCLAIGGRSCGLVAVADTVAASSAACASPRSAALLIRSCKSWWARSSSESVSRSPGRRALLDGLGVDASGPRFGSDGPGVGSCVTVWSVERP
jgi:hypothetical protein